MRRPTRSSVRKAKEGGQRQAGLHPCTGVPERGTRSTGFQGTWEVLIPPPRRPNRGPRRTTQAAESERSLSVVPTTSAGNPPRGPDGGEPTGKMTETSSSSTLSTRLQRIAKLAKDAPVGAEAVVSPPAIALTRSKLQLQTRRCLRNDPTTPCSSPIRITPHPSRAHHSTTTKNHAFDREPAALRYVLGIELGIGHAWRA